jgi:hypothetical protein
LKIDSAIFATPYNKAYPRRSEYLTWASPHCAKGRATSGKQDVIRNFFAQLFVFKIFPAEIDLQNQNPE